MNKKPLIPASDDKAFKLKALAEEKEDVRRKLAVTAEKLRLKAKQLAVTAEKKETVRNKLVVTAEKKETVRNKLVVTAEKKETVRNKLVVTAQGKEDVRRKLAVTARQLAMTAKEKESIRRKLAVTAKQLAVTAKEKEDVRRKLAVTAVEKERVRNKLVVTAKEKESIRRKLAVTAKQLAVTAKEKEDVRRKLAVTAVEKERVRNKLVVTAKEKEDVRRKLAVTARQLAMTAKEKESIRRKLAVTAVEKERVRNKLAVTAEELHIKAKQLAVTAKQLAVTAKEKEDVRRKLAVTAEELRLNAKQLAEAKAKDEAMLASIGDGLVATDTEGKIALMNKAFEEMLGWKEDEIQGKLFSEIVPMVDENGKHMSESGRSINIILKKRVKATITTATSYYKRRDGTYFPVVITTSPIFSENEFIGVIEVFRDITKEKDIDKAKTEFVSLASHQLRTPLTTVSWYSEMLLAGDAGMLNDAQKKYLDEIYKGNKRMVDLVNALLNVSRMELGTFIVEPEPTDILALARSVVKEFKPQIEQKKLKFSDKYADNLPLLNADPKLLRMVFQNLLSNAIKYTPDKGKITLELTLSDVQSLVPKVEGQLSNILIKVSDNGYGIPKDHQNNIFTKLFRADNVREKDTEGTGLGLYIVKAIVDHSGGKIWFESEENKGATFFVTLPLAGMKKKEGTKTFA